MFYFQAGTVSSITSAGAPDFSTLPMAALVCIMQHVPLRSRMGSSSRVCTAWTDAAAAATTTFDLELCSNHSSLAKFLWKHGRMVTSMELRSSPGLAQLPCPKLLRLSIQQCSLHLSPGSQLARDIASATQLSSIQLNQVVFKGEEPDLASVLGALPNLQELTLHNLQVGWQRSRNTLRLQALQILGRSYQSSMLWWSGVRQQHPSGTAAALCRLDTCRRTEPRESSLGHSLGS